MTDSEPSGREMYRQLRWREETPAPHPIPIRYGETLTGFRTPDRKFVRHGDNETQSIEQYNDAEGVLFRFDDGYGHLSYMFDRYHYFEELHEALADDGWSEVDGRYTSAVKAQDSLVI